MNTMYPLLFLDMYAFSEEFWYDGTCYTKPTIDKHYLNENELLLNFLNLSS